MAPKKKTEKVKRKWQKTIRSFLRLFPKRKEKQTKEQIDMCIKPCDRSNVFWNIYEQTNA